MWTEGLIQSHFHLVARGKNCNSGQYFRTFGSLLSWPEDTAGLPNENIQTVLRHKTLTRALPGSAKCDIVCKS